MSSIVSGKVGLDMQLLDSGSIAEAAVESIAPAAEAKEIQLRKMIDPEAGVVYGDSNRLQQVIWNLLSNAVKFTPKHGRVDLTVGRVESHLQIMVRDTGLGIHPEFLPHVFDRFRQEDLPLPAITAAWASGWPLSISLSDCTEAPSVLKARAKARAHCSSSRFRSRQFAVRPARIRPSVLLRWSIAKCASCCRVSKCS